MNLMKSILRDEINRLRMRNEGEYATKMETNERPN